MLNELGNPAAVVKLVRAFGFHTLVLNRDADAFVQKGLLTQAFRKLIEAEFRDVENLGIRQEGYFSTPAAGLTRHLQFGRRDASLVLLLISRPVPPNFQTKPL